MENHGVWDRIYRTVARIPKGRVATYGQIARAQEASVNPRIVGYALAALDETSNIPWHRVIRSDGSIAPRGNASGFASMQRLLLEAEGLVLSDAGRVDLAKHRVSLSDLLAADAPRKHGASFHHAQARPITWITGFGGYSTSNHDPRPRGACESPEGRLLMIT